MKPAAEPCLQLLQRSYCYLRLSGVDSSDACLQLRSLIDGLDADDCSERVWERVRAWADQQAQPSPRPTPGLLRGGIRYPAPGG